MNSAASRQQLQIESGNAGTGRKNFALEQEGLLVPSRLTSVMKRALAYVLDISEDLLGVATGAASKIADSPVLKGEWEPQCDPDATRLHNNLPIVGTLPEDLNGAFIRVGPNFPVTPPSNCHLFDGDGACAVFRMENGSASLDWQWVKTEKLIADRMNHRSRSLNLGSLKGFPGIFYSALHDIRVKAGIIDYDESLANTALLFHARKLLVFHEAYMPYSLRVLCDGALETIGRVLFDGDYDGPFTAHPKIHPDNGRVYAVSYSLSDSRPPVTIQVIDSSGKLSRTVPIRKGITRRPLIHDMAITKKYVIVMDLPMVLSGEAMVKDNSIPIVFNKNSVSRFGLLPIDATHESEMKWFALKAMYIFHTICAHDEDDSVVLWACHMCDFNLNLERTTARSPSEKTTVCKIVFHVSSGRTSMTEFEDIPGWKTDDFPPTFDFPTINPSLVGLPARYCYLAAFERSKLDITSPIGAIVGCSKFDMLDGKQVGKIRFDEANDNTPTYGGESVFIPRQNATSEDDGWLATIVTDHKIKKSALYVYDAKSMDPKPIAIVRAPVRLPSGFHATFVPLDKLRQILQ